MQPTTADHQEAGPAAAAPATRMAGPPAAGGAGGAGRATAASAARTPMLPPTPLSGPGEQAATPATRPAHRVEVYDDEGRFDPAHGVLGLPNWVTTPLIPTHPEAAPELTAAAEQHLAAARSAGQL